MDRGDRILILMLVAAVMLGYGYTIFYDVVLDHPGLRLPFLG